MRAPSTPPLLLLAVAAAAIAASFVPLMRAHDAKLKAQKRAHR